jgi:hypothetical protein
MRAASSNLQTWKLEIDAIGVALKGGSISIEEACERLAALGLLAWLPGGNQHG